MLARLELVNIFGLPALAVTNGSSGRGGQRHGAVIRPVMPTTRTAAAVIGVLFLPRMFS